MVPAAMKAQVLQPAPGDRPAQAASRHLRLHSEPFGLSAASEGNPTVSFRLIEDDASDASDCRLRFPATMCARSPVGQLMRDRGPFSTVGMMCCCM
jgi:hypothetical protein